MVRAVPHASCAARQGKQRLATALFDAHLCVAEYLLYGPVPYDEVIDEAEDLRRRATRAGALRGVAFATALIGEAALLMGDLDAPSASWSRRSTCTATSTRRPGRRTACSGSPRSGSPRATATRRARLLEQALPLARWSVIARHLLQRIYGTMITAAGDPEAARAVVDRAEATLGSSDRCIFCAVMLAVPAAIACADVGDLEEAGVTCGRPRSPPAMWEGAAWPAALLEARAHLASAEGRHDEAVSLTAQAAPMFRAAGHLLDARRCEEAPASVRPVGPARC